MANKTVTSDTNLEDVFTSGLGDGENLTIENGAVVTMTQTNSKCIGRININNGTFLIDGVNITAGNSISLVGEGGDESVDEIIKVGGQGKFIIRGDWYNVGTTDGTDSQVIDLSSATGSDLWNGDEFISWLPMIQIETGRRIYFTSASGITPKVGDWLRLSSDKLSSMGKIKEVGVDYLILWYWVGNPIADGDSIEIRSVVDNNGPDLQKSWTAIANGSDIKEAGVFQEFGNSMYNGVSYIDTFHHGVGGFVFDHAMFGTSLQLGSSAGATGGFVPPSGCTIRVPNVMISSAIIDDFNLGNCTDCVSDVPGDWYQLECSSGGEIDLKVCNLCNFYSVDSQASKYQCEYVGATLSLGSNVCGTKSIFRHCVVVQDPQNTAKSPKQNSFNVTDNVLGSEISFCMVITPVTLRVPIGAETSIGVSVTDCIITQSGGDTIASTNILGYYFNKTDTIEFHNNVSIGNDTEEQSHQLLLINSPNFNGSNFQFSTTQDETQQSQEVDTIKISTFSNNFYLEGIEVIGGGMTGNNLVSFLDTNSAKLRCAGMIDDKMDFQSTDAEFMVSMSGICSDIDIARMWKDCSGTIAEEFISTSTRCKNILVQNCSGKYSSKIKPSGGDNIRFKGVHGGSGNPGSTTGWEDIYTGSYGNNFHDGFQSDTTGSLACLFITPSLDHNEVTVLSGNPKFFKDGDLDMVAGDSLQFEMGYYMKGHTGFTGEYSAITGTGNWGQDEWGTDMSIEFQWKLVDGPWSSWLDLKTPSNLTDISGNIEEGIKFRIKLTLNSGSVVNMSMVVISTTTSLTAQANNLYPIDQFQAVLKLTGLQPNTEVRCYTSDLSTEIGGVENSTDTFSLVYDTLYQNIVIQIHHPDYETIRLSGINLTVDGLNIPIQQRFDRNKV